MTDTLNEKQNAARAVGRSFGALFFSFFGGAWLVISSVYFHHFTWMGSVAILLIVGVFVVVATRLRRRGKERAIDAFSKEERERNDRQFGWINAVTYLLVFLLFLMFPRLGLSNYVFPAFVALVGLHFFPMPRLYQSRANRVTGVVMISWAIVCTVVFKQDGERMAAFVTLGAGSALWISAAWALRTAAGLLRSAGV